ncbi:MAG: glycosyltransferase, partial [Bacteroidetes bacterium]|nr:glycosyltransferase [Bacteroidota bacterium]
EEPSIKRLDTPAQELAAIKKELEVFSSSGHKSLGIICKTQAQANALYEQLKDEAVKIKLLNANSSSFGHGIILTTAHLAKGLEFDQVVVPYASAENYQTAVDKSMLYIACTRAMHRLSLSCVGEISSLARKKSNEVKSLKMVKVSVLLPVRNGEATLSTALDSLWSQSLPDFEVVLVNDGSTDATSDIIAACTDERLKVINLPPCGIAAALNKGLQHCSAPLVARMDADDVAHPQRLEKQWRFMQQHSEVAVLASCVVYGGNAESKQGYARYVAAINQLITHQQMWNRRFWDAPLAHPSVMYHKQVVLAAGGYSQEAVPEDYDLWLRLFARGCFFAKLTEKLIIWNDGEDRLSRTHPNYDKKAFWRLKAQYFADWLRATYGDAAPKIYLWGETSRKQRSRYLLEAGVTIAGRIHYDAQPTNPELIPYTAVPHLKNCLILVYVSNRMGQQQIMDYLSSHGFTEGQDFFLMV